MGREPDRRDHGPHRDGWDQAQVADAKLHDFLFMVRGEDAQILVETPDLEYRGFEGSSATTQAVASTNWTR